MKVYVIGEGEYSDFRVIGVVSSKEEADRLEALPAGLLVQEFEVDDLGVKSFEWHASVWLESGEIRGGPEVERVEDGEPLYRTEPVAAEFVGYNVIVHTRVTPDGQDVEFSEEVQMLPGREYVYGWGRTPEAALKSAWDRRAKVLAERAGI